MSYCVQTDASSVPKISANDIEMAETPIAKGRFGKVYRAKWKNATVAIKVVKVKNDEDKKATEQEVSITLRMKNKNVIKQFGITPLEIEKLGIVMEWAEHGSLDIWIGKTDRGELTNIALGIVSGLMYVHSQNVMHGDIKPRNILLSTRNDKMCPKLSDFGLSKVLEQTMAHTARAATIAYMAPEVKWFIEPGFKADIFSLARMLFEIFNEQLLSNSSREVQQCIGSGIIPENCNVPMCLRNVVERGWNERPQERPSLSEFYSTLKG